MDKNLCIICGDSRDVKKHYGVASFSRNKCRACRFAKCQTYMKIENLRDTRKYDSNDPEDESPKSDNNEAQTNGIVVPLFQSFRVQRSLNFIEFLYSMNKACDDYFDPKYEYVTYEHMVEIDKIIGRHVTLEEGLQHPEYVVPRTKNRYTCDRVFRAEDISFYWYRTFVRCADFANLIPQFRELPLQDQCQLFRLNFATLSWSIYMEFIVYKDLTIGFPMGNGSYAPWNSDEIMQFLKDYNVFKNGDMMYKPKQQAMEEYKKFVHKNMIEPIKSLKLDEKELCLLKVMLLFQQEEHLSDIGREIALRTNNILFDTLWDYQEYTCKELSFEDKMRRYSRFLLLTAKIGAAWHMESDIHLLMSIFGDLNLEGIPKELLFNNKQI